MTKPQLHPLRGLIVAQFFGAFNDNAFKLFVALLSMRAVRAAGLTAAAIEGASQTRTTIAFVVFTLPLVLVSLPAGLLADRAGKRSILIAMKGVELCLMVAGTMALAVDPAGTTLPLVILGLMGAQSALFSPAKYGILPEILPHARLSWGNGLLEMWTFVAIIAGTAAGGPLLDATGERAWIAGAMLTALAIAGLFAARTIPRVPPARSEGDLAGSLRAAFRAMRADRALGLAVLGSTFFWGIASLLGQDVLVYIKTTLGIADALSGAPLALFGVGVGAGTLLAGKLSAEKVEYGLLPMGAVGLALLTSALGLLAPGFAGTMLLMALLGIASGLLVVPLNAILQWRAPADRRGAVIALANVFIFTGILGGSLMAEGLSRFGVSPRGILVGAALVTLALTLWAVALMPVALLRLALVLLTHTFYRVRVVGAENVPRKGGALLVPNHVSFVDGLLVMASLDRNVHFVVDADYFHHPLVKPFAAALGAIPISASGGPRMVLRALRDAGKRLDEGKLVCIFAEGEITRTGMMLPFKRGMERIAKGRTSPVIPVNLDRVWGSVFSRAHGRFVTKLPESIPYPVTMSFGAPLPAATPLHEVRRAVHELGESAARLRETGASPLHHTFVRGARRHPLAFCFAEAERPWVSRFAALTGAVALARGLREAWRGQSFVGILLPPSVAAAEVNIAVALAGRTSVNLNYTSGRAAMSSAVAQAGVRSVVTSRTFLERAKLRIPEGVTPIWIEEIASGVGPVARAAATVAALALPLRLLERACGAAGRTSAGDIATVIFSSGSTGEPKGVLLTHFNVDSNASAVSQVFRVTPSDRILGILPLFHSFGFLALWVAASSRVGIVFHPSPLDAGMVGELVQRHRVTMLLATPTFLKLYMRRCTPAQFGSLRLVLAGAEKLGERLASSFEETFGIRPLEGYGATECSPAIAVSSLDFRGPGFYQPGSRRGFVGQPLPGVAVRIVDPDTFAPLPPGSPGMLIVRGPNVMKGYLGRDDLTAQVMRDGWYVTGDIALMDEDGFVKITDRLSRFSKIGGEMVPHGRVEEALHEAASRDDQVFAVTAVPDERKGERLAVLHTLDPAALPAVLEKLSALGLPNLFIPQLAAFVKVERLPLLGSGKLDLREIRRVATEALAHPRTSS